MALGLGLSELARYAKGRHFVSAAPETLFQIGRAAVCKGAREKTMKKINARVRVIQVPIHTDYIKLDSFLKLAGVCFTGGEAKELIAKGGVRVNAAVAAERSKKLRPGDKVTAAGKLFELQAKPLPQENLTAHEQADRL